MPKKLVIVRHGESVWSKDNFFTGWHDVDLTDVGKREAKTAGEFLKENGFTFDIVFTSVLKRAIKTAWIILDEMNLDWIPMRKSWHLNERHYGALEGLSKTEQAILYGEEQVHLWRRSYDVRPPQVDRADPRHPQGNPRYADVNPKDLPTGESLKDVVERFVPYWNKQIVPQIRKGKRVLIVAHGNSLRALVKHIAGISDQEIVKMNLLTGIPRVYELHSKTLKPIQSWFAADDDVVERRIQQSIRQGSAEGPTGQF